MASVSDISSVPETRSTVQARLKLFGDGDVEIDGWVYLRDPSKPFLLRLNAAGIRPGSVAEGLRLPGADLSALSMDQTLTMEGNVRAASFSIEGSLHGIRTSFFRRDRPLVTIKGNGTLDFSEEAGRLNALIIRAGDGPTLRAAGVIKGFHPRAVYDVAVSADAFDLGAIRVSDRLRLAGMLTAENLRIRGTLGKGMPDLSGRVMIRDGSVNMAAVAVKQASMEADIVTAPHATAQARLDGRLVRAGRLLTDIPFSSNVMLRAGQGWQGIHVTAAVSAPSASINSDGPGRLRLDSIRTDIDGRWKENGELTATIALLADAASWKEERLGGITADLRGTYGRGRLTLDDLRISAGSFSGGAARVSVKVPDQKDAITGTMDGIDLIDEIRKVRMRNGSFRFQVNTGKQAAGSARFSAGSLSMLDVPLEGIEGRAGYSAQGFYLNLDRASAFDGAGSLSLKGASVTRPFPLSVQLRGQNLSLAALVRSAAAFARKKMSFDVSGRVADFSFSGAFRDRLTVDGTASAAAESLSVRRPDQRYLIRNSSARLGMTISNSTAEGRAALTAGAIDATLDFSGENIFEKQRAVKGRLTFPQTQLTNVRSSFWDIFPDRFLYAGLDGSLSGRIDISYADEAFSAEGSLGLRDITIEGENGEYTVGPVNGTLPVAYATAREGDRMPPMPAFDKEAYEVLRSRLDAGVAGDGFETLTVGSVRYGFRLVDDITVRVRREGRFLNAADIRATIFGGKLLGSAVIGISEKPTYRAGFLLHGLSLTEVCDRIEPIRGYISGRVDGVGLLRGQGPELTQLIGKADFWTYRDSGEKTQISRAFLQKVGGPQVRAYLGDRSYDRGVMGLFLRHGFIVFHELEISNRNFFGVTDLSIKVAPFNNRIAISDLLWTISEAAYRAKKE